MNSSRCESQGNYQAYSSVGPFLGAFQFLQSTWNWVAGIHYPRLVGVDPRDAARRPAPHGLRPVRDAGMATVARLHGGFPAIATGR